MTHTNPTIVQKVMLKDTFSLIPRGDTAVYPRSIGSYSSVYSAVARLNSEAGAEAFDLDTNLDGSLYLITRNIL